jgi:MMP 1-O-methyltransferase
MYESIFNSLRNIEDFYYWYNRFKAVFGYLSPYESYTLKLLAGNGKIEGEIVEIGSFMGKSTCWLAAGAMNRKEVKVNAVDHFKGSPEHQAGKVAECKELVEKGSTFDVFMANIKSAKVAQYVNPLVGASEEVARTWTKPISLLFIDGDHSYDASKRDFEMWSPFVATGGIIAFHDIKQGWGVTEFYRELMNGRLPYQELMVIQSLAVVKKFGK